jgi:hypothetical protein
MKYASTWISVAALSTLVAACGGGGGGSTAGTGTLQVHLTDAPACGFDQVNVTVTKVRVHRSDEAGVDADGWQEVVLNPARKINLLDLTNGVLESLGQTTLPAGQYTQVRLLLAGNDGAGAPANSVVPEGSASEIAIDTPSALQSGLKLKGDFDVAANAVTDLVLDFDACKSIVKRGNGGYLLKPVISVIAKAASGGISGYVTPGQAGAIVSAQQDGVVIKSTVPDAATGAFTLSPMPPSGSANYVVVVNAEGRTTAAVTGVPVSIGANTILSTSATPIPLSTAATETISGTVSPASAQATLRAMQTLTNGGARMEVAFTSANADSGAYSMSLPVAAPLVGTFGSGALPITFAADTTAAGRYTLEASAAGYATHTEDVDLAAGSATRDFTLAP